jgi:2-iminobutanoate/2-iminopropanoate deaminase
MGSSEPTTGCVSLTAVPSQLIMPADIAPPAANYAHAVLVTGAQRWLHTSGVVPVRADGSVPDEVAVQAEVVWQNLVAILADAQMDLGAVVSVTTYVVATVAGEQLRSVMAARDTALGGRRVASTLVTVPALAQPAWLVEIAIVAAS